jgi:2-polyprenyl-3-methyl-5-hydroxy-6-metoxy-1,4-benzoquinol methylase
LEHQQDAFGFPDIHTRARNDLAERNLHWLKVLLKYRLPPADVLELGCAHGSFVALMRQAGYQALGVEMSPWVVAFGQETFGVPIRTGPIESLDISPASLDAIALMDVMEHLPDPITTLRHCLELLKPEGLLVIQTPCFKEGVSYETLVETKDRFLEMLIPEEHIYLFSQRSAIEFFRRLCAECFHFETAIFVQYDMFFVVSRAPLAIRSAEEIEAALTASPHGRLTLALLDIYARESSALEQLQADKTQLVSQLQAAEADRSARLEAIELLTDLLRESETDRAARGEHIEVLTGMLRESEADRAEQSDKIETMMADLRTLFSRLGFRSLTKLLNWPEAKKLAKYFESNNE